MQREYLKIKTEKIYSIEEIGYEETYDIENFEDSFYINEPNFFANGFLVHNSGKHAGGVVVLDRPVYELIPVDRVSGNLVTAFPESGQVQTLDEVGVVKFDILGISILDVIANTLDNINEKLYLIEDDDGIKKIVPESYVNKNIGSL